MENSNSAIPTDLVGSWVHNRVPYIVIRRDGSGNLLTLNDGKWSVNGDVLEFRRFNSYDLPLSGSVQYSIIGEKLHLLKIINGDLEDEFRSIMPPNLLNGLDKI
jgi:hypothetical protein